jgi:hypothetical protein
MAYQGEGDQVHRILTSSSTNWRYVCTCRCFLWEMSHDRIDHHSHQIHNIMATPLNSKHIFLLRLPLCHPVSVE